MITVLSTFTIINTFKLFFRMWKLHSIESLHSWTFTTFGTDSTLYLATTVEVCSSSSIVLSDYTCIHLLKAESWKCMNCYSIMIIVLCTFTTINTFKVFFQMWKLHLIESLHSWTFTTLYLATTGKLWYHHINSEHWKVLWMIIYYQHENFIIITNFGIIISTSNIKKFYEW